MATSVPDVIYTIPTSSPVYFVTYVRIYEADARSTCMSATRRAISAPSCRPYGTVVYGTGYAYTPWVGIGLVSAALHLRRRGGTGLQPACRFHVWFRVGSRLPRGSRTTARITTPAYWGAYPCCATATANVYGQWGNTAYSGTADWPTPAAASRADRASRQLLQPAHRDAGNIDAGRQYNAWTGNASRGYDRSAYTAAGGYGNVARGSNSNVYTGQRSTASSVSGIGAGGSTYQRSGATTAGPAGYAHAGEGSTYNAQTGKTNSWDTASVGNNHYADVNGNVYKNDGSGWQQHSSSGWSEASGDTSWADRESQARSTGDDRSGGFSGADRSWGRRWLRRRWFWWRLRRRWFWRAEGVSAVSVGDGK